MELKPGKIYYSMGEVAEMFDVNQSLIRFWEQRFDILKPRKNKKGNRLFTPEDIKNLEVIYHLVKERGMTLAGADKYMRANKGVVGRDTEIVRRLQDIRSTLLAIKDELKDGGKTVFVAPEHETYSVPDPAFEPEFMQEPEFEPEPLFDAPRQSTPIPEPVIAPEPVFEERYEDVSDEELLADDTEPELEREKEDMSLPFTSQELFSEDTFAIPEQENKQDVLQQSLF